MALKPGTQLGTCEILALIGAGGMGEVYKARDAKLNRLVAIKVLPPSLAADAALLARFDREAKAVAALSHPNVLGIHDLATQGGLTYAVMELLEGESLRDRLKGGALPPKRAVEIATELAQGLGAAHERGIIHRDVKPENIFITAEGRVKVLDFGLAKQVATAGRLETETLSLTPNGTEAGLILGTTGYMSPEQVKGEPADHRADVFAFGVVLYEMLSGQRPFRGETAHHTLTAILDEDPPALVAARGPLPPALERLVAHCLEKNPKARFQSMQDIAFALQNLSTATAGEARPQPAGAGKAWRTGLAGAAAALALVGLLAGFHVPPFGKPAPPTFTRITFTPGTVESAFFGPDGRTIYYSNRVGGGKPDIYTLHPGDEEPRAMDVKDAILLGVSAGNEMLLLRHTVHKTGDHIRGVLAQVPAGGGAVRDLQEEVADAVVDSQGLAALLTLDDRSHLHLEFPLGHVVFDGDAGTYGFYHLRLAPDQQRLAMVSIDNATDARIETLDRAGTRRTLYSRAGDTRGDSLTGLAWGPGGELWFSETQGDQTILSALSGKGRPRMLWRGQGHLQVMDVSPEGQVLMAAHQMRRGVLVQRAGESQARDLSLQSGTQVIGLSDDGRNLLLLESPAQDGGTIQDRVYLRPAGGGPALRLARGNPRSLSQDGRWVHLYLQGQDGPHLDPALAGAIRQAGLDPAVVLDTKNPKPVLLFLPTGLGRPWALAPPAAFTDADFAHLLPDGQRVVFIGAGPGVDGWWLMDRRGGPPQRLAPERFNQMAAGLRPLSPDGTRIILIGSGLMPFTAPVPPVPGQEPQPIRGVLNGERIIGWTGDGRGFLVRPELSVLPVTITRVDGATGARTLVQSLVPPDRAGHLETRDVFVTPDLQTFAFDFDRKLSELYLVDGVK